MPCLCSRASFTASACPVEGTLKGWDQLLNLVLDDVEELVRGACCLFSTQSCLGMPYFSLSDRILNNPPLPDACCCA